MIRNVVAGTGHRPDKLGGYSKGVHRRLIQIVRPFLEETAPDSVISGMALGWDQAVAEAALDLGIPVTAAVPFHGQESKWPLSSQRTYFYLLGRCSEIKFVSDGFYSIEKMQLRNEWMVDHCTELVALWDGSPGGTANCLEYARRRCVPYFNLWHSFKKTRR